MMMILVAGSTGGLGGEIVRRLRERGEPVRGLVRSTSSPEIVERLKQQGVEVVIGDLKHRASLDAACRGVKTVISTVTTIRTTQAGDSFQATDAAGNKSLIDAATKAGAEHFIFVSFDAEQFPSTPLTDAKKDVEEHLRSGRIDYTILQPPQFMDVWLGPMLFGDPHAGQVKVYGAGMGKVAYISMGDVAEVAVNAVFSPSARNKTIKFTGPELLSQREVVEQFETAVGKPLIVTEVPEQVLEVQWKSAQNPFEKTFAGLMLGLAQLNEKEVRSDQLVPQQMLTVHEFAQRRAGGGSTQA
ncbi:MAG TPA: SDR family oxidoreductase [Gemmatimonadaceae bacterium]|nr:SDR family oxidoreductase [Gemmatimonadaceae bacterium]